jgi:hypothetical protein
MWEDVDFYELQMEFIGNNCNVNIDIYNTNEELDNRFNPSNLTACI